ncbi:hypothetical protein EV643_1343 [Kribbella sp. VKM Ac-2527]|uniref:Uncharacterized protein n=1 Tax=Kribbella caucasensis TaxID=2512215 RepID=A0A4R6J697_9ACTN|nr:hypothetical protein [Kribbella sp. VKM Ac-2527]TDO30979.1 hypothetical protein EV643_1343 [Kribbella sp. VKM Ac-2527]
MTDEWNGKAADDSASHARWHNTSELIDEADYSTAKAESNAIVRGDRGADRLGAQLDGALDRVRVLRVRRSGAKT